MATSFEFVGGALRRIGDYADLGAAARDLPDGAYTTFRTYRRNRVLRLGQHARRLEESVALMGRAAPLSEDVARAAVGAALRATGHAESRFRLTFAPPQFFVAVEPFAPLSREMYDAGVRCVTASLHRDNPHAKSTAFGSVARDVQRGLPSGVNEALMVGDDAAILEGLSSNFFAVAQVAPTFEVDATFMALRTEEARALMGVTRTIVLELAREMLPVSTDALRVSELASARECFITSVSREVLPVVKIDDVTIGDGAPGSFTRELMRRFADLVQREANEI